MNNRVRWKISKRTKSSSRLRQWQLFGIGILAGAAVLMLRLTADKLNQSEAVVSPSIQQVHAPIQAAASPPDLPQRPSTDAASIQENRESKPVTRSVVENVRVRVYINEDKRVETLPLERYVRGVLAGEMPITFELEALKAQAIAARTYIIRRLENKEHKTDMSVPNADVTNTVEHQVYIPQLKLMKLWPADKRAANLEKLNRAIDETRGLIITYDGNPIEAAFFSTSNGYTENSEEYWDMSVPYLRSVASPWDQLISPKYMATQTFKLTEFYQLLGAGKKAGELKVLAKTAGNRIKSIRIGSKVYTGREVREKLGLASSEFSWKKSGDSITITTYGYGHGVGMSQWGANGMAEAGEEAADILRHYYSGTKVEQARKLPTQKS
ncbi:stage II sporulation protein D [Paenibacillus sp. GCM10023252]|uniref:stage II sporulation protein D n=1 Tax=Paenibacillus sp. GCM10023252 TaxID=3252649 RepID=UPI0036212661